MKILSLTLVLLYLIGCQSGLKEDDQKNSQDAQTNNQLIAGDIEKFTQNSKEVHNEKLKGKWLLADFYDKVRESREFWTIDGYPISWFADIEIKDSTLIAKGWHEEAELNFEWTSPATLKTTDNSTQYFIIEFDERKGQITAEEIYNNKSRWKHTYVKAQQINSPDMSHVAQLIKQNCLAGRYKDLTKNQLTEIDNIRLADFTYKVETDYEHICSKLNILTLEISDSVIVSSWDWSGDTLKINRLIGTEEEEGCYTYKKGELIKKLLLTTTPKKH